MYQQKTRPDRVFAVNQDKRFSESPTEDDINTGIQILKNLKKKKKKKAKEHSSHYN